MKKMERNKGNRTNSEGLDSLSLMENAIDLSIQEEYFHLSETIDIDNKEVLPRTDGLESLYNQL